jgi:hypothetical protein
MISRFYPPSWPGTLIGRPPQFWRFHRPTAGFAYKEERPYSRPVVLGSSCVRFLR